MCLLIYPFRGVSIRLKINESSWLVLRNMCAKCRLHRFIASIRVCRTKIGRWWCKTFEYHCIKNIIFKYISEMSMNSGPAYISSIMLWSAPRKHHGEVEISTIRFFLMSQGSPITLCHFRLLLRCKSMIFFLLDFLRGYKTA